MADNYTASDLAETLHDVPHYNFAFKRVDSQFAPDDLDYDESIGVIAFVFAAFALLAFLCEGGYLCAPKSTPSQGDASRIKALNRAIYTCGILAVIAFGAVVFGMHHIENDIDTIDNDIKSAASRYDNLSTTANVLANLLSSTATEVLQVNTTSDAGATARLDLNQGCDEGASQIRSLLAKHQQAEFNSSVIDKYVHKYNSYVTYATIGLTILMVGPIILVRIL